jgi:tRNA A37 threonylcarbamoyladenosine dehydratase
MLDHETTELNQSVDAEYRLHRRFDRMGRLIGDAKMAKLLKSHVMIVGLGGVGSWAAEAIARSGVGKITLVEFDQVCITNANRQLHALSGLVGQYKVDVMAERLRKINPQAQVHVHNRFYNAESNPEIFAVKPDLVIDAIDNVTTKCHLLAYCREQKIPVVTSTGSGGRMDPTRIQVVDLAKTEMDPLARSVRKILRQQYGFPANGNFGILAAYSDEQWLEPEDLTYDKGKGFTCVCPQGQNEYNTCDQKNLIMGNAGFVTGAFGLVCASVAIRTLTETPKN